MSKFSANYLKNRAKGKAEIAKDYDPKDLTASETGSVISNLPATSKGTLPVEKALPTVKIEQNVGEIVESKPEALSKQIGRGEQVLAKDVMQTKAVTKFDEEGNPIDLSDDKAKIRAFDEEYALQKKYEPKDIEPEFFDFKSPQEFQNKFSTWGVAPGKGMVSSIVKTGEELNKFLDNVGTNFPMDINNPDATAARDYLISNGLATQADASAPLIFDRKVANSLSTELIEAIQNSIYVEAIVAIEPKADKEMTLDELDSYFGTMEIEDKALAVKGTTLLPEYVSGSLARNVLNKIVKNPYQKEIQTRNKERDPKTKTMYTRHGGAGSDLQANEQRTFDYIDTIMWAAINDADFIDKKIGVDGKVSYAMNLKAVDFFDKARPYIYYANRKKAIPPSLVRPMDGEALPFSYSDADKRYTVKAMRSDDDAIQRRAKDNISSVKHRINPYLDNWLRAIAEIVIGKIPYEEGRFHFGRNFQFKKADDKKWQVDDSAELMSDEESIVDFIQKAEFKKEDQRYGSIDREMYIESVLKDPEESKKILRMARRKQKPPGYDFGDALFSNDELWAKALKLNREEWEDAYYNAMRDEKLNEAEAVQQANTVMMAQAKRVMLDVKAAEEFRKTGFYLPVKDIAANGRYHYVGNIINPQASKTMRQIMANANARPMDLSNLNEKEKERLEGFKYVIGKNILPKSMTKGIPTKNMGWNAILESVERVLSRSTPEYETVYKDWLNLGQLIRGIGTRTNAEPLLLLSELDKFGKEDGADRRADLQELMDGLSDPEEWGMVMQSYIDFANYHDAMQVLKRNRRKKENPNVTFVDQEYEDKYMTLETEQRLAYFTQELEDARERGDEASAADYESEILAISEQFSFKQKPSDSTMFNPLALTSIDGKQNGLAIQAYQSGDVDTLKLVGMIYQSGENVIPQGDIRKRFGDNTELVVNNLYEGDKAKLEFWQGAFQRFNNSNRADDIMKLLSKQPLMETSYGKWMGHHFETAENFINSDYGAMITDAIGTSNIPEYTERKAVADLTNIIKHTLNSTLDLNTQQLHKDLGTYYAMMGTTPSFIGPLGNTVYLGSRELVKTGESINVMTAQGLVEKELGRVVSSGQKRSKAKKILDEFSGSWRKADLSPYGQEVRNQIVVLPTQHIDGAVMATGVNYANRGRRPSEDAVYQIPVHDSEIFDSTSAKNVHRSINRAFNDVNSNYSTNRALLEGLVKTENAFKNEIRKGDNAFKQKYHVTLESVRWRALHDYILSLRERAEEKADLKQNESREINELLTKVTAQGWSPEGSVLTGLQLAKVIAAVGQYLNIKSRMEYATKLSDDKKSEAIKELTTGTEIMVDENNKPVLNEKGNYIYLPEPYHFN